MSLEATKKIDTNRYELEVKVDAKTFEKGLQKAYNIENKKIVIPGFRKGKAPRAFVEKYYGEQVFYDKAINVVYPDALDEAIEESGLEVIQDKMDLNIKEVNKENGFTFTAAVTTKPEVSIDGYKGIDVNKKSVEVTDDDVEKEINQVRERNSRMITVEDRNAQKDDIAVIDFEGFVDGVAFDGGKGEDYPLTLGSGQFIPGFEDQIIGHGIGEEFDVNVKFPDDYQAEDLKGKDAVFKVKLKELKIKELPELDDEFVKDVSEFDNLNEYREDINKNIATKKENEAKDDIENQLINKLVELIKAEIPEAMFENKVDDDLREFSYRLQSQGLNIDTYMKYTGMDINAMRSGFREQAERQVKVRLALEKIAENENIEITDEDVNNEYKKIAEQYKMDVEKVKFLIGEQNLKKDIAVEKAMNLVRESANIK